jgi:hypothetical protein
VAAARARRSTTAEWSTGTAEQIAAAKGAGEEDAEEQDTRTRKERGQDEMLYERDYQRTRKGRGGSRPRRRGSSPAERLGAVRLPASGGVTVDDGAGLLLGLFAYAVVLQWFEGGAPQVKRFLAAKFVNKTG